MNQDNLDEIVDAEYEYIFGERLKSISQIKQDEILDLTKYNVLEIKNESGEKIKKSYKNADEPYYTKRT
ncbi:MAG: hypothetical protein A2033_09430 [Bacteroidetes bacterium GWA2_31_9]|nr:MAG: hypothetical protein A2033_09430 [Bacteroidetes bacterium GWA2_31_9]